MSTLYTTKENKVSFRLTLDKKLYGGQIRPDYTNTINHWQVNVVSGAPVVKTIENKSRYKVVNLWRKLIGTYYQENYEYLIEIIVEDIKEVS